MFHTKLSTVRSATNFAITTNAKNRLPFVSELLENGSIFTGAINSHRNLHVLCIKPAVNARARSFSLLDPKIHNIDCSTSAFTGIRSISTQTITKSLRLLTENDRCIEKDPNTLRLKTSLDKPLVILLPWLMAKPNHIKKYAQLYVDQGFDVMSVQVTPWQVMWPKNGSQLVAAEVVKFLGSNVTTQPLMLHGLSVGGYLWGECMVHMSRDIDRYRNVIDRIQCQVWDSAVELSEIPIGVPKAVFPKNDTLQRALGNYLVYHMKTFHEAATKHYIRSSQIFHSTLVKKPALFLLSKSDPIGSLNANTVLRESYESLGIRCDSKVWDKSPHVGHFHKHRDDYITKLYDFLQTANMVQQYPEEKLMQARI